MKKSPTFLSQFGAFGKTKFRNFLQPWRRNNLHFRVNLKHLVRRNFKNFFNHGEEIYTFLSQFGIFGKPFGLRSTFSLLTPVQYRLSQHVVRRQRVP